MELKFGKYKGHTIEEVAQDEQGRGWLSWYLQQPCSNPKFEAQDRAMKDYVARVLGIEKPVSEPSKDVPKSNDNRIGELLSALALNVKQIEAKMKHLSSIEAKLVELDGDIKKIKSHLIPENPAEVGWDN